MMKPGDEIMQNAAIREKRRKQRLALFEIQTFARMCHSGTEFEQVIVKAL